MNHTKKAFTLVELIVVITILAILGTIGFLSFQGYQISARDAIRVSDVTNIGKTIELSRIGGSEFPQVAGEIDITFSGATIWKQGSFGNESYVDVKRLSELPTDPLTQSKYMYSHTNQTGEYEIGGILEKTGTLFSYTGNNIAHAAETIKGDFAANFVRGNYNGKFIVHQDNGLYYVLGVPTILANVIESRELSYIIDNDLFIYNGKKVVPPSYSGSLETVGTGWNFTPTQSQDAIDDSYNGLVYKGDLADINSGSGKLRLGQNLHNYYNSTDITDSPSIQNLLSVDVNNTDEVVHTVNNYIKADTGGFISGSIELSEVNEDNIGSGSGSTGDPNDPDCTFDTPAHTFDNCNFTS